MPPRFKVGDSVIITNYCVNQLGHTWLPIGSVHIITRVSEEHPYHGRGYKLSGDSGQSYFEKELEFALITDGENICPWV